MFIKVNNSQSSDNLLNKINEGNILVLYHADWCGYCTEFLPTWKKLINKMKTNNQVYLGEIEHKHLQSFPDPGVKTFPSLKFYKRNPKYKKLNKKTNFIKLLNKNRSMKNKKNKNRKTFKTSIKNNHKNNNNDYTNNKKGKDTSNIFKNLFNNMNLIYNRNEIKNPLKENNNNENNSENNNENNSKNNNKILNSNVIEYDSNKERTVNNLLEFIRKYAIENKPKTKTLKTKTLKTKKPKAKNPKAKKSKAKNPKAKKSKAKKSKAKKPKQNEDYFKKYQKLKSFDKKSGNEILEHFNMPKIK